MKNYLKPLLAISISGLLLAGLGAPSAAREIKDAPLVDGLGDLRKLNEKLVTLSKPSAVATVSLVSIGAERPSMAPMIHKKIVNVLIGLIFSISTVLRVLSVV
ncbi:MAG: hypothetical protein QGG01_01300, partial [Roseibacillus sp.]|nr:hypothetical protein [Roseibacillus sp.]